MSDAPSLEETLSRFADRLFRTGGEDPGAAALDLPEERLAIYRELVENDYEVMLRFALTQSCKLVTHEIEERAEELGLPPTFDDVILRHLQVSPSTTTGTREMCERFHAFLPAEYPRLFASRPELTHLLELERAEARAYYHEDDPGTSPTPEDLAALGTSSVDAFLGLEVLRAPSSSHFRFPYPASDLYAQLRGGEFPPASARREERVTVSRNPRTLLASILEQPETVGNLHGLLDRGETARVETLAERWIAELPAPLADAPDEARFTAFGGAILKGLESGFFRLS